MISEEDLNQDPAKARADALLKLNDPKFVQDLLSTRAYWGMALEEAVSEAKKAHSSSEASGRQRRRSLDPALQKNIRALSGSFSKAMDADKTMTDSETNPDDPYETVLTAAAGTSDIKSFFSNNPQLFLALVADEKVIADFTSAKGRAQRSKKIADGFLRWVDILHRSQDMIGVRVAPVQWAIMFVSSPFALMGAYLNYRAAQNNPDYPAQQLLKARSVLTMIASLATLIAIPLVLGVAGAAVVAPALGILMTVYSLTLCVHNFVQLGKGLVDLYKEFKQKNPEETYKLRLSKQALQCVKSSADVLFYLATSAVAITGLVGLFGNPIVLATLAGAITMISYVTLGVYTLSTILQKVADKKITTVEEGLTEIENQLKKSHSPHAKRLKNLVSAFKLASKVSEAFVKDAKENPNHDAMKFLMKQAAENKEVILNASSAVGMEDYAKMAEKAVETIDILKNSKNPILQGIEHFTGTETTEALKEVAGTQLSTIIKETALVVKIPKKQIKKPLIKEERSLASEAISGSELGKTFDQILRYQSIDQKIKIHLNANPTDEALMTLMELNKDLQPLKMKACGDSNTILRVMEASKLMGVQVDFAESDIALLKTLGSQRSKKDRARLDYFKALEAVDTKKLQEYLSKHHEHHLGEVLDSIPKKWRPQKPRV